MSQPITFRVYTKYGKLKPGIKAAYLQTYMLNRTEYLERRIRTYRGDFILQDNPEIEQYLRKNSGSVQVICSFQIHDTFRIAVCKIKDVRHEG